MRSDGPSTSARGVEPLLGVEEPDLDERFDGVGPVVEKEGQHVRPLGLGEVLEDEVGGVLASRRPADPEADSEVVLGADRLGDGAQAVVPALTAALLEADDTGVDVELVVDDDEAFGGDVVVLQEAGDRAPGDVHVGRRDGQDDLGAGDLQADLGDPGAGLVRLERGAAAGGVTAGELLDGHRADVVPVAGILRPRVAEPDDEPGVHGVLDHWSVRCRAGAGAGPAEPELERDPQTHRVATRATPGVAQAWSPSASAPSAGAFSAPSAAASSSDSSRSIPASASASASSASRASSEMACVTLTTRASASVMSVAPSGSSTAPARICVPAWRPSTEMMTFSGMLVASASTCSVLWSSVTTVSGAASPSRCTATSTVTFSPLRTTTRSTWSMTGLIASRWTSLARASCSWPSMTIVSSALACLSAIIVSWPGSEMCTGSVPWPYMTAGMLPARRIFRAAPLPKSVRFSATSLVLSDTGTPEVLGCGGLGGLDAGRRAVIGVDLAEAVWSERRGGP